MKKAIIILALIIAVFSADAQGIFNQKASQLRRLAEQIAALQAYKGVVKKGYQIAKTGLKVIGDFKNGEFTLHKVFFNSLKTVNPKIKKWSRVADIIAIQIKVAQTYSSAYKAIRKSGLYREDEILHIYDVFTRMVDDCRKLMEDLLDLITDGKVEMKDDERMEQIESLYEQTSDLYRYVKSFSEESMQIGVSRMQDKKEISEFKNWFNIE